MATLRLILLLALTFTLSVSGNNITAILNHFPEYTDFNNYLTQTKLADDINSRHPITVLVFNNSVSKQYLANLSLADVKVVLSIHALLDYFDLPKLQSIGGGRGGSQTSTTLYQTTGKAEEGLGFVRITNLAGGKVGFGSEGGKSKIDCLVEKSVQQIPYNISVIEITTPVIAPGKLPAPAQSGVDIVKLLNESGCGRFGKLISTSGVLKIYQTVEAKGLTLFAPSDAAFDAPGLPDFSKLSNLAFDSLLLYHAVAGYVPRVSLMTEKSPVKTLASTEISRFDLMVRVDGEAVTLDSGIDASVVESTVVDSVPVSIFKIDHVLLPAEYYSKSPAPAPVPEVLPPSPPSPSTPSAPAPVHKPNGSVPAPIRTPPASPSLSPVTGAAPADNPAADTGSSKSGGAYAGVSVPGLVLALVTSSIWGIRV